jgi:cytochrome c
MKKNSIAIALVAFSCKGKEEESFGKPAESTESSSEGMPAVAQTQRTCAHF